MNKNLELLLDEADIQVKIEEFAKYVDEKYAGQNPVVVGIMKGSLYFLSDLTKKMTIDFEIDIMSLSSYKNGKVSSGVVRILKDLDVDVTDRPVIIIEDIVDSGTTLQYLNGYFANKFAKSVETFVIFEKEGTNKTNFKADNVGFVLPNVFLVGYGLDFANKYRNLPSVYKLND